MYKVIVVGGGISGLTSTLYLARAGYKVDVFNGYSYGSLVNTSLVENFPGFPDGISGVDLLNNMYEQISKYDNVDIHDEKVTEVFYHGIRTDDEVVYDCDVIIVATGCNHKKLEVLNNINDVHYCAICDGSFYKGKDVVVIGGGNTALSDALYLSDICNKVYIVHRRDEFRAETAIISKVKCKPNILFQLGTNVVKASKNANKKILELDNKIKIEVDGIFVAIGFSPNNELLKDVIIKNNKVINHEDIFICGDVTGSKHKQAIIASGDGAETALQVIDYLRSK